MTSIKKILANQKNAKKSTGPKSVGTNLFPSINQNRLGSSRVMQKEKNYEYY